MLSGRGLCDELITRSEESYRLWCVVVCDLENLKNEEAMARVGPQRHRQKKNALNTSRGVANEIIRLRFSLHLVFAHKTMTWHALSPKTYPTNYKQFESFWIFVAYLWDIRSSGICPASLVN